MTRTHRGTKRKIIDKDIISNDKTPEHGKRKRRRIQSSPKKSRGKRSINIACPRSKRHNKENCMMLNIIISESNELKCVNGWIMEDLPNKDIAVIEDCLRRSVSSYNGANLHVDTSTGTGGIKLKIIDKDINSNDKTSEHNKAKRKQLQTSPKICNGKQSANILYRRSKRLNNANKFKNNVNSILSRSRGLKCNEGLKIKELPNKDVTITNLNADRNQDIIVDDCIESYFSSYNAMNLNKDTIDVTRGIKHKTTGKAKQRHLQTPSNKGNDKQGVNIAHRRSKRLNNAKKFKENYMFVGNISSGSGGLKCDDRSIIKDLPNKDGINLRTVTGRIKRQIINEVPKCRITQEQTQITKNGDLILDSSFKSPQQRSKQISRLDGRKNSVMLNKNLSHSKECISLDNNKIQKIPDSSNKQKCQRRKRISTWDGGENLSQSKECAGLNTIQKMLNSSTDNQCRRSNRISICNSGENHVVLDKNVSQTRECTGLDTNKVQKSITIIDDDDDVIEISSLGNTPIYARENLHVGGSDVLGGAKNLNGQVIIVDDEAPAFFNGKAKQSDISTDNNNTVKKLSKNSSNRNEPISRQLPNNNVTVISVDDEDETIITITDDDCEENSSIGLICNRNDNASIGANRGKTKDHVNNVLNQYQNSYKRNTTENNSCCQKCHESLTEFNCTIMNLINNRKENNPVCNTTESIIKQSQKTNNDDIITIDDDFVSNIYSKQPIVRKGRREIVIDGSSIALGPGYNMKFCVQTLKKVIYFFLRRGHKVKAFVPHFRIKRGASTNKKLLNTLVKQNHVILTPSRFIKGCLVASNNERYVVQYATHCEGIIVSYSKFSDIVIENAEWRKTVETRQIMPVWCDRKIKLTTGKQFQCAYSVLKFT